MSSRANSESGSSGDADATRRFVEGDEIARGGTSEIRSLHDRRLVRDLALKRLLESSAFSRDLHDRFVNEARVTARLDHPSIPPVHDFGLGDDGRPWFTMKRIEGRTFEEIVSLVHEGQDGWTLARGLEVIRRVCDAMAFAHSHGVLHRDLKPANVMVGRFGEVYVMDWGLAKVVGHPELSPALDAPTLDLGADATHVGTVLGTPAYMPPEQARGDIHALDERGDVYAIGALLYELLAGAPPYSDTTSTRGRDTVRAVLAHPPRALAEAATRAPEELVAIANRAMARAPQDRYPSADDLRTDLDAYAEGRVVSAHRTDALTTAAKWIRRNQALAIALIAVLILAAVSPTALYLQSERAAAELADERDQERAARRVAEGMRLLAVAATEIPDDPGLAVALALEGADAAPGYYAETVLQETLLALREVHTIHGHTARVHTTRFVAGGTRVVSAADAGAPLLHDAETGELVAALDGHDGAVRHLAVSARGDVVATADEHGGVRTWSADTGAPGDTWGLAFPVTALAWTRDDRVVAGTERGAVVDLRSGAPPETLRAPDGDSVVALDVLFDTVTSLASDGAVRSVSAAGGPWRDVLPARDGGVLVDGSVAALPDGRLLVLRDQELVLVEDVERGTSTTLADGERARAGRAGMAENRTTIAVPVAEPPRPGELLVIRSSRPGVTRFETPAEASAVVLSPDGSRVVTTAEVRRVAPSTGRLDDPSGAVSLIGHTYRVGAAAVRDDGRVVTGSGDHTVRLWAPWRARPRAVTVLGGRVALERGVLVPAGDPAQVAATDHETRYTTEEPLRWKRYAAAHSGEQVLVSEFLPSATPMMRVREASADGAPELWSAPVADVVAPAPDHAYRAAFSPDGTRLALTTRQRFSVVDALTGDVLLRGPDRGGDQGDIGWSRDGAWLVTADNARRTATLWDATTAAPLRTFAGGHEGWCVDARLSPDGNLLATAGSDGRIVLWDATTAQILHVWEDQYRGDITLAFAPDGRALVHRSDDSPTLLLDVVTRRIRCRIDIVGIRRPVFVDGGRWMLLPDRDGTLARVPIDAVSAARALVPRALTDGEEARFGVARARGPGGR